MGTRRVAGALAVQDSLAQSGYGHLYIEHNRGHHVRVATPEDPVVGFASVRRLGVLARSVFGSLALRVGWSPSGYAGGAATVEPENLPVERRLQRLADDRSLRGARMLAVCGLALNPVLIIRGGLQHRPLLEAVTTSSHYGTPAA